MLKKLLEIKDISKSYPGVVANEFINMNIKEDSIAALIQLIAFFIILF